MVTSLTLELKPVEVKSSITVSAEAQNVSPTTVTEKIIHYSDERADEG